MVAACPGSRAELIKEAASTGATVFLTGEMDHRDQLRALRNGVSIILAGHSNTVRGAIFGPWAERLRKCFPELEIQCSKLDCHPLQRI